MSLADKLRDLDPIDITLLCMLPVYGFMIYIVGVAVFYIVWLFYWLFQSKSR